MATNKRKDDNAPSRADTAKGAPAGARQDVLKLLKADHERIKQLFREFESLKGSNDKDARKAELSEEICQELNLHAMLEDELFYPAVRSAIDNDELIDEAEVEHAGAKDLISQLEVMYPGDDHFDATVAVLTEEVERHIEREENDIFPAARKSGLDLRDLAEKLQARKEELEEDLMAPPHVIDPHERINGRRAPTRPPE
ncbi:MAG: hemerythrin domain-containing protein [Pseudomonadota bacterium]